MTTVKTKKYQMPHKTYIRLGLRSVLQERKWVWFIPLAVFLIGIATSFAWFPAFWWCFGLSLLLIGGYWLFWFVQFWGLTQVEQGKQLFKKMSYEIDSRYILMKTNANEGAQITWDKIQKVEKQKNAYVFTLSRAQFIYLPFDLFKPEETRFVDFILKRKNLIHSDEKEETKKELAK